MIPETKEAYYPLQAKVFVVWLFSLLIACKPSQEKAPSLIKYPEGKKLAQLHCQGCHQVPKPQDLDRSTWKNEVLPKMGLHLGIKTAKVEYQEELESLDLLPEQAAIDRSAWLEILNYYIENAPIFSNSQASLKKLDLNIPTFQPEEANLQLTPLTTLIHISQSRNRIFLGNATEGSLHILDESFTEKQRLLLGGAPSHLIESEHGLYVLSMGQVMPHEKAIGALSYLEEDENGNYKAARILIDSLKRPVHAAMHDFDQDGKEDMVIASFGNLSGELAIFFNIHSPKPQKKILRSLPGASRLMLRDWNQDGQMDILALMAQGEEGIFLYTHKGKKEFEESQILRNPPSFGSTYFDLIDFNQDGREDILYVNGDNGDYFPIMKDYHGIHVYLQNENGGFEEEIFLAQNGAFKALVEDYDLDGDLDIAAISYFPDYKKRPHEGFVYYQNQGNLAFEAFSFPESTQGKWLSMDKGDLDKDGDEELLLGSGLFMRKAVSNEIKLKWRKHAPPLFVLYNTSEINRNK